MNYEDLSYHDTFPVPYQSFLMLNFFHITDFEHCSKFILLFCKEQILLFISKLFSKVIQFLLLKLPLSKCYCIQIGKICSHFPFLKNMKHILWLLMEGSSVKIKLRATKIWWVSNSHEWPFAIYIEISLFLLIYTVTGIIKKWELDIDQQNYAIYHHLFTLFTP